jgi:hypothetical protein
MPNYLVTYTAFVEADSEEQACANMLDSVDFETYAELAEDVEEGEPKAEAFDRLAREVVLARAGREQADLDVERAREASRRAYARALLAERAFREYQPEATTAHNDALGRAYAWKAAQGPGDSVQ